MVNNQLTHVAFILDGNKRWAKKNNFPSTNGYKKGFENIKNIIDFSINKKIPIITLYTLSSENLIDPLLILFMILFIQILIIYLRI